MPALPQAQGWKHLVTIKHGADLKKDSSRMTFFQPVTEATSCPKKCLIFLYEHVKLKYFSLS